MFHVHVSSGPLGWRQASELNLERDQLMRVVQQWRAGQIITVHGKAFTPTKSTLRIYEGPRLTSSQLAYGQGWLNATKFGEDVTKELLQSGTETLVIGGAEEPETNDRRSVFVVHGRDTRLRDELFVFLLSLKLKPLEWPQLLAEADDGSPYVGDVVLRLRSAAAVVILMTPDDLAKLREELVDQADPPFERELTGQARQNVIFEAGIALALVPKKTVLVGVGQTRPFSDVDGRWIFRLTDQAPSRVALAEKLRSIGCDVDTTGDLWLKQGRFAVADDVKLQRNTTLTGQRVRRIANVLAGELEEALDLIGNALQTGALWAPERRMPTNAANAHLDELAADHSDVHKAVRDAYRKVNDVNWQQMTRAAAEQPGAILAPGESLILTDADRQALRDVLGVIQNALDALSGLSG